MRLSFSRLFIRHHIQNVAIPYWENQKIVCAKDTERCKAEWRALPRWTKFWSCVDERYYDKVLVWDLEELANTIKKCENVVELLKLEGVIDPVVLDESELYTFRLQ